MALFAVVSSHATVLHHVDIGPTHDVKVQIHSAGLTWCIAAVESIVNAAIHIVDPLPIQPGRSSYSSKQVISIERSTETNIGT